jgi:hypothetical protein
VFAWSPGISEMVKAVELTKLTLCATPLYVAVAPETKFEPLIVRVCAVAPATAEAGERLAIVGTGLFIAP